MLATPNQQVFVISLAGAERRLQTGLAVVKACEDVIAQCKARAALTWELDVEQVDWRDGQAVPKPGVNLEVEPLSLADMCEDHESYGRSFTRARESQCTRCGSLFLGELGPM